MFRNIGIVLLVLISLALVLPMAIAAVKRLAAHYKQILEWDDRNIHRLDEDPKDPKPRWTTKDLMDYLKTFMGVVVIVGLITLGFTMVTGCVYSPAPKTVKPIDTTGKELAKLERYNKCVDMGYCARNCYSTVYEGQPLLLMTCETRSNKE